MNNLQNVTINKILESKYENKDFEYELDQIWVDLKVKLEDKGFTFKPYSETAGYKEWGIFTSEPIKIKEGVQRRVEIDCFYALPSFPTYYYYIGAQIDAVEESTNETSVAGLTSQGYTVKNEIRDARISISSETGSIVNKGNTVEEFIQTVDKVNQNLANLKIERF